MKSTLQLNVLPLHIKLEEKRFSFFKSRQAGSNFAPLYGSEIPWKLQTDEYDVLYTDFSEREGANITVSIDLNSSPNFSKHYLNSKLFRWFEGKAYIRRRNFINNPELYFITGDVDSPKDFAAFDRFVLRATTQRITEGAELTVMYRGTMKVWKKPVLEYPGPAEEFSKVVYKKTLYRYSELMEHESGADQSEIYPVLNRRISRTLELPFKKWKKVNKLKRHTNKIQEFYDTWLCDPDFRNEFSPDPGGFLFLDKEQLQRIPVAAADLRFGKGVTERNPMEGMKRGGSYHSPACPNTVLFIIVPNEHADQEGKAIFENLNNGYGHFPGLRKFTGIPIYVSNHLLTFSGLENPVAEIEEKIRNTTMREDVQYGAVYISPIHKSDPDPAKNRIYYRLKEMLLKYDITSQVIYVDSVNNESFSYFLPNIATAIVAKLGGTPWTLNKHGTNDLVIGIGAYRPKDFRKTYLGSAFCFTGNGEFKGFESFTADDMVKLAGSFQRAIRDFRNKYSQVDRVVLHFYKEISREEVNVLKKALDEIQLDIPLVVLTIYKSGSKDLVIADLSRDDRLPLSGTWYRSDYNQFLVCNNTRFDKADDTIRSHPFPVKVQMNIAGLDLEDEEKFLDDSNWAGELLKQVYQFSRLNWRSVSTKAMPVTIAYPEMVAEKFPYFDGNVIPAFGRRNFWFL